MAILVKISWFFSASSKLKAILKSILKENGRLDSSLNFDLIEECEEYLFGCNRQSMPTLSETRWLARIDTLSWLMQHYTETVDAMEQICIESSGQSASDATSYKFSLLSFQFIISVVIIQFVLGYSRALCGIAGG